MAREDDEIEEPHILSIEPEQALADNVKLLIGFHLNPGIIILPDMSNIQ